MTDDPRYHGLGHLAQNALSWVVNVGGTPYASDLPSLHSLAANGYATRHNDGTWHATDAGRALLPPRMHKEKK